MNADDAQRAGEAPQAAPALGDKRLARGWSPVLWALMAGVLALAAATAVFVHGQLERYDDDLVTAFAAQQEQTVSMTARWFELEGAEKGVGDIERVLERAGGTTRSFWVLSREGSLEFVRNAEDTATQKGFSEQSFFSSPSARAFIEGVAAAQVTHGALELDGRPFVASATAVELDGARWDLCLLTARSEVVDDAAAMETRVNLGVTAGIVLSVFVGASLALAFWGEGWRRRARREVLEGNRLRARLEALGRQKAAAPAPARPGATEFFGTEEAVVNDQTLRVYRFRVYLNARHSVSFDGVRGDAHPHTWEFTVRLAALPGKPVPFSAYEEAIDGFFAPYQNADLNGVEPFDALVPTLENIVDWFGARLRPLVREMGCELLEFEGSESPTRSYGVVFAGASGELLRGGAGEAEDAGKPGAPAAAEALENAPEKSEV